MIRRVVARGAGVLTLMSLSAFAWVESDVAAVLARRNYWAFQKPIRPATPTATRNPVDAFILEGFPGHEFGMKLMPADKTALLAFLRTL